MGIFARLFEMDGERIPMFSELYIYLFLGLILARACDFGSTWLATPNLQLEANPVAKRLGWKWGILLNFVVSTLLATYLVPAVMLITTSLLVAARNLDHAWLMRSMGEINYQMFMGAQLRKTSSGLVLGCFWGNGLIYFIIGLLVALWTSNLFVQSIGFGIIGYSIAVVVFTTLSLWRSRRNFRYDVSVDMES